jgi:lysine 2,3-aminomutase
MDELNQVVEAEPPSRRSLRGRRSFKPPTSQLTATETSTHTTPSPDASLTEPLFFPPVSPGQKRRHKQHRFPLSPTVQTFKKRFYPDASVAEWNDWRWQLRHRVKTLAELARIITLSADEEEAIRRHTGSLPVGITPYYAHLIDASDPNQGLRRTHVPVLGEYLRSPGEADDPLAEDHDAAVPGLVHRYPDRVLFLATGFCSTYCRYCTRSRMVGEAGGEYSFSNSQWDRAIEYLKAHSEVRDVLISGGDPLTLHDDKLNWLLSRLREIKHIEFVRLGTKVPVVLPQRVTKEFARMLRKHRVWMSLHFTHPDELTPEVSEACDRLADSGIPLGSQTVLLKGVKDDVAIMKQLMHGLLMRRVKPYYIYQCDPITGSAHFRTTVDKGLEIIEGLRGHTTGYAVPNFVVDAPGGGGKIPLIPDYLVGKQGDDLLLRNFEGKVYRYTDPEGRLGEGRPLPAVAAE